METAAVLAQNGDFMQNWPDQILNRCDGNEINAAFDDIRSGGIPEIKLNAATGLKLKGKRRRSQHCPLGASVSLPCTLPHYYQYLLIQSLDVIGDSKEQFLPIDPRNWTKCDVRRWLQEICRHHDIDPALDPGRFPFNGKALCALTLEMVQSRAPLYGKLLYKDIRLRLAKAVVGKI